MAFLGLMLRAGLRHRWRSWAALSLLAAVVLGMVLAGVQTARRTQTAFHRFEAAHGFDATAYGASPLTDPRAVERIARITTMTSTGSSAPQCNGCRPFNTNGFSIQEASGTNLARLVKIVAGRMPNQADPSEVLASYNLDQYGIHVGSVLRLHLAAASQRDAIVANLNFRPRGPVVTVRVVGQAVSEFEFPGVQTTSYDLYATSAFAREYNARSVVFYEYMFNLRHGRADLPRFQGFLRNQGQLGAVDMAAEGDTIATSIAPQAVGWWILTGLAALVGLVVLLQALARQSVVEAEDFPSLGAVGATRRQLFSLTMARTLAVAVVGAAGAVVLALVLSVFAPVGEARLADPNPGFDVDPALLLAGAAAGVAIVLALGIWPAVSSSRLASYRDEGIIAGPSRTVALVSSSGAPPSMLIGVRNALERGRGRRAIPVGSAVLGVVLAVTVLCGTAVFGASLNQLTSVPVQYGQGFDAWFGVNATGTAAQGEAMLERILHQRGISAVTAGVSGAVNIDGKVVDALAGDSLRGPFLLPVTTGRHAAAPDEIVLGAKTMRDVGAHLGSTVRVAFPQAGGPGKPKSLRVVGTAVLPPDFNAQGLGTGAVSSLGTLTDPACRGPADRSCIASFVVANGGAFLVRAAPGPQGSAALEALRQAYPTQINFPVPPPELVNFGQAVNFPLIFGCIVVLFGAATLLHLLLSSLNRRRREIGLLKTLGLLRYQVALSVGWQTTTLAVIGIVIGVPLGIAAGRAVWTAFAHNLGVGTTPVVTAWIMVALAVATLIVANLLAVVPAFFAARSRPASLLRTE